MSMIDIVAPIEPAPPHVSSRGTSKSAVIVETIRHDGPSGLSEAKCSACGCRAKRRRR
jgi:hypothetical protein